ncbi:MAG: HTTM domain-containing protein, partial [Myxococcota bacterium]
QMEPLRRPTVFANLILFQLLLVFFFAGVEKVMAGWPFNNEMAMLLQTPRGYLLRDWAADLAWLERNEVGVVLSWATIVVELLVPLGLLVRRTRLAALVVYEGFFIGVMAAMEVPPLFFALFAFGMLLILDDRDLEALRRWGSTMMQRRATRGEAVPLRRVDTLPPPPSAHGAAAP